MKRKSIIHQRPDNVGTSCNIPDDVCMVARLDRDDVIAWTTLDPLYYLTIDGYACCQQIKWWYYLPCFWPHMIIMSPCFCTNAISNRNIIENTYWILTSYEVKVIVMNHNVCIPGCCRTGDTVKSIPLDTITDCGANALSTACCGCNCCCDVPTIYIDTASSTCYSSTGSGNELGPKNQHEAVGYGLVGYDWFVSAIISQRSEYRNRQYHTNDYTMMMDRGDSISNETTTNTPTTSKPFEYRLQKLKDMQNMGMINDEEYDKKRLEIIASI